MKDYHYYKQHTLAFNQMSDEIKLLIKEFNTCPRNMCCITRIDSLIDSIIRDSIISGVFLNYTPITRFTEQYMYIVQFEDEDWTVVIDHSNTYVIDSGCIIGWGETSIDSWTFLNKCLWAKSRFESFHRVILNGYHGPNDDEGSE
jgi:hypothetical protein